VWNCACQRGRAAATGALSTHSAPAPSQGRNLAKQARMKLGQEAPCSPAPGALSQAQKDRAQKITPADPTQPPSSSREFSQPVRAVTAQASAVLHRAVPTVPRSECGQRGRPRRGPPGRLRRPPSRAFCRFCWEIAFCGPRARRVCMARGPFDVGPCPTHPGVSAGRVGRVAGCAGARRAAGGGLKIVICHDMSRFVHTAARARNFSKNGR
jgi:hypothetical protein